MLRRVENAIFSKFWNMYPRYRDGERTISVGPATATFPIESSERAWGVSPRHGPGPGGEGAVLNKFTRAILPGDVVWDVGAYWGLFTCLAADCVNGGAVVAFEPDHKRIAELRASVELNRSNVIEIRELALSDADKSIPLMRNQAAGPSANTDGQTVTARQAESLFAEDMTVPDVLKVDVEGAEGNVIAGFEERLAEVRHVFVELHPKKLRDFGHNRASVEKLLADAGFKIAEVDGTGNPTLHARQREHTL